MSSDADVARQLKRYRRMTTLVGWWPRWLARVFSVFRTRWVLATGDFDKVRKIVSDNLDPILPPGVDRAAATERLLRNYGMFLTDYFRIPAMKPSWMKSMFWPLQGMEHIDAALAAGKGAILATAHLGNWELGGIAMRMRGLGVTAVAVPDSLNVAVTQWRDEARRGHGIEVVNVATGLMAPLELARALEANRVVAMLVDRNFVESDPVELDFFGRKAKFPRGPALLSQATGAPILPAFVIMGAKGKYVAEVGTPIRCPEEGTKRERTAVTTRKLVDVLERKIRENAEQWYIFDPYWGGEPQSNTARAVAGLKDMTSPLQ
ncbi:MAG: lysophospholipid acyltransferase family protein [Planctomycetes bacterium]|nr:lysophospholipid acyltransferase family protein [Planctomycetota bacterium]